MVGGDYAGPIPVFRARLRFMPKMEDFMTEKSDEQAEPKTFKEKLVHEVRTHPFGYSVVVVGLVAGPILAMMIFPEAPPAAAAVGGLCFGIYAAISSVPQKFL